MADVTTLEGKRIRTISCQNGCTRFAIARLEFDTDCWSCSHRGRNTSALDFSYSSTSNESDPPTETTAPLNLSLRCMETFNRLRRCLVPGNTGFASSIPVTTCQHV